MRCHVVYELKGAQDNSKNYQADAIDAPELHVSGLQRALHHRIYHKRCIDPYCLCSNITSTLAFVAGPNPRRWGACFLSETRTPSPLCTTRSTSSHFTRGRT